MKIGGMVLFVLVLSVEETTYVCVYMCVWCKTSGASECSNMQLVTLAREPLKWDKRERLNKLGLVLLQ